jgi:hypothetical protein
LAELQAQARRQSEGDGSRLRRLAVASGAIAMLVGGGVLSVSFLKDGGGATAERPEASSAREASSAPNRDVSTTPPSITADTAAPLGQPSPSAARTVELTVSGAPEGAEVLLGDRKLGSASERVLVPYGEEPVALTITAPEHEPKTIHLTPKASMAVSVPLVKVRRAPKPKKTSADLENPF